MLYARQDQTSMVKMMAPHLLNALTTQAVFAACRGSRGVPPLQ